MTDGTHEIESNDEVGGLVKPLVIPYLEEWNTLDVEHKKFVIRVRNGNGGKRSAEPHYDEAPIREGQEYPDTIPLWEKAESTGFIECIGSYRWIVTDKFHELESDLFGV